jgi:hypothetical protein
MYTRVYTTVVGEKKDFLAEINLKLTSTILCIYSLGIRRRYVCSFMLRPINCSSFSTLPSPSLCNFVHVLKFTLQILLSPIICLLLMTNAHRLWADPRAYLDAVANKISRHKEPAGCHSAAAPRGQEKLCTTI